jgi:TolB protein
MSFDPEFPAYEPPRPRRLRWIACFLLVVFLCGTAAAPLAALSWWWGQRQEEKNAVTNTPALLTSSADGTAGSDLAAAGVPINQIAFIDLDAQLGLVAPDGSGRRMLTTSRQFFQFPAWSPDGIHLAVIAGDEDGSAVLVFNTEETADGEPEELYRSGNEAPFYLYWSPDSRQVSFLANHPEDGIALHLGRVGAGSSHLLTTGQPLYWDWSAGSDRLLIHTGLAGEQARLALVEASGDGSGGNIAQPGFFQAPGISPSGRYQAYAELNEADGRFLVVEDTESSQRMTEAHNGLVAMGWSPAEDKLAYIAPPLDADVFFGPLQLLDATTGHNQRLTDEIVLAFFWSPDGRKIAYFTIHGHDDDGIQAFAPYDRARTSKPGAQEGLFLDLWLVDVDTVQSYRLATFEPSRLWLSQFLPFFDQYALSHSIWSPDSSALVLPMVGDEGRPGVYVVSASDGRRDFLTDGVIGFWSRQ